MNNHLAKDFPGLDVYLQEQKIGRLWLDEKRRFIFQYDTEWIGRQGAVPLSLLLHLRSEPYPDDLARPFFSNLLPEADIKRVIAQRLRISVNNDFAMLNSIGGESRPSWIQRRHWERFGEAVAIGPRLVLKTLQDMAASVLPAAQKLADEFQKTYGTSSIIEKILAAIEKRAKAA